MSANYVKTFTSGSVVLSISERGAVKIESNGRFVTCLTPKAFTELVSLDREVLGHALDAVIEVSEAKKKNAEVDKIKIQRRYYYGTG